MRNYLIAAVQPGKDPGLTDATPKGFCLLRGRELDVGKLAFTPPGTTLYRVGLAKTVPEDLVADMHDIRVVARPDGIDVELPLYELASPGRPKKAGTARYRVALHVFGAESPDAIAAHFGGCLFPSKPRGEPRRVWLGHCVTATIGAAYPVKMLMRPFVQPATFSGGLHG